MNSVNVERSLSVFHLSLLIPTAIRFSFSSKITLCSDVFLFLLEFDFIVMNRNISFSQLADVLDERKINTKRASERANTAVSGSRRQMAAETTANV